LQDFSAINNTFYITEAAVADIIIVPEPCTLLLLGLTPLRRSFATEHKRCGDFEKEKITYFVLDHFVFLLYGFISIK